VGNNLTRLNSSLLLAVFVPLLPVTTADVTEISRVISESERKFNEEALGMTLAFCLPCICGSTMQNGVPKQVLDSGESACYESWRNEGTGVYLVAADHGSKPSIEGGGVL
jgi:hypothetical protein